MDSPLALAGGALMSTERNPWRPLPDVWTATASCWHLAKVRGYRLVQVAHALVPEYVSYTHTLVGIVWLLSACRPRSVL